MTPFQSACRAVVVPHGVTDVWSHRIPEVLLAHAASALALALFPRFRTFALAYASTHHISRDWPSARGRYTASVALHAAWVWRPALCLPYLALVHTPLHYRRVSRHAPSHTARYAPVVIGALTALTWCAGDVVCATLSRAWGDLWWVAPVVAHTWVIGWSHVNVPQ